MTMAKKKWIDFLGGIMGWLVLAILCVFFFLVGIIDWFDLIRQRYKSNKKYLPILKEEVRILKNSYYDLMVNKEDKMGDFFLSFDALLENTRRWLKEGNYFFSEGKTRGFEEFLDNKLAKIGISFNGLEEMQEQVLRRFNIREKKDIKETVLNHKSDYSNIHQRAWIFFAPCSIKK
jgi:hypothetical protein